MEVQPHDAHLVEHQGATPQALQRQVYRGAVKAGKTGAIVFRQGDLAQFKAECEGIEPAELAVELPAQVFFDQPGWQQV